MIPHVNNCYFISRENNMLFANLTDGEKVPLVRLKQSFVDMIVLERQHLEYMEKYMEMFPDLWELITEEKQNQLTLF